MSKPASRPSSAAPARTSRPSSANLSPSAATSSRPSSANLAPKLASRPSSASPNPSSRPSSANLSASLAGVAANASRPTSAGGPNSPASAPSSSSRASFAVTQSVGTTFVPPADTAPSNGPLSDVYLILRPMCGTWQMGEDWRVYRSLSNTFLDIAQFVEDERGISRYRIQIRYKGKVVSDAKMKWTLRRTGISSDDVVLQIEPTLAGAWWWHTIPEYTEKLLTDIERVIDNSPNKGIFLHDLETLTPVPPPLESKSLRVFLRIYPERFHIYTYTCDNTHWVRRTHGLIDLPIFSNVPHDLGRIQHFVPKPFDWDAYADIDDKYVVEVFETVEEQAARIEREAAEKERQAALAKENKGKVKGKAKKERKKEKKIVINEDGEEIEVEDEEQDEEENEDDFEGEDDADEDVEGEDGDEAVEGEGELESESKGPSLREDPEGEEGSLTIDEASATS